MTKQALNNCTQANTANSLEQVRAKHCTRVNLKKIYCKELNLSRNNSGITMCNIHWQKISFCKNAKTDSCIALFATD